VRTQINNSSVDSTLYPGDGSTGPAYALKLMRAFQGAKKAGSLPALPYFFSPLYLFKYTAQYEEKYSQTK